MSSKAELNAKIVQLETHVQYAAARFEQVLAKNKKLNERLARRRNGFWRRIRLRVRALMRGN